MTRVLYNDCADTAAYAPEAAPKEKLSWPIGPYRVTLELVDGKCFPPRYRVVAVKETL